MPQAAIIAKLPKVELHCHLDGSIPLATLHKLAQKDGLSEENLAKAAAPAKCLDLGQYLASFDAILPLLQSAENLTIATFDLIAAVAADQVRYIEIRFAPLLHRHGGLSAEEVIQSVIAGVTAAQEEFPVTANLLICGMRHHSEADNLTLIETVSRLQQELIVGFDFAGDEARFDNQTITTSAKAAISAGLKLTLHSGECGCAQNVVEAIKLGAMRIGHGVAIKDDPAALQTCVDHQTLLEMCPSSNLQTNAIESWAEYPLRDFMEKGVKCSISTDNRTVSQTTLSREFALLFEHCQLSFAEMQELTLNALAGSFTTDETKAALREELLAAYAEVSEN